MSADPTMVTPDDLRAGGWETRDGIWWTYASWARRLLLVKLLPEAARLYARGVRDDVSAASA